MVSASTRQTAMTAAAKPAEASSQNGVPVCGWAPLSQAQSHCPTELSSHPGMRAYASVASGTATPLASSWVLSQPSA
jgi:hypothetical protein